MRPLAAMLSDVRKRYEKQPSRDRQLVCANGLHMNCDVLKLRKATWTNDDLAKINSPTGGIFFSIWIPRAEARSGRANYNIHSYRIRELKSSVKQKESGPEIRSTLTRSSSQLKDCGSFRKSDTRQT